VPKVQERYFAAGLSATRAGTLSGLDERGVEVIAHAAAVPGTPWVVIAKVDLAEALVDLDTIAMFSAALATLVLMVGSWWWVEQQGHVSARLRHRLERARLSHRVDFLSKQASDSVLLFDAQGRLLDLNDRCLAAYAYERPDFLDPAGEAVSALAMSEVLAKLNGKTGTLFETVHRRRDGTEIPVEVAAQVIEIEGRNGIQMVVRDISERIDAGRRILALSRLHKTISAVNQAIVRGRDLESVFASVCQACVDHGRFRTAWACLVDSAGACTHPVVSAGAGGELVDTSATRTASSGDALDPTCIAIRERRTCVCNHIASSQVESGWREQALRAGVACAIALPLTRGNLTIGVLTVYGSEADGFDEASVALLTEMAENLKFSIEHFEQDKLRQEAERARAESARRLNQVSRRVVQVQEEERRRLAVELHDTAGTSLVAVQFNLAMAERSLRGADPAVSELLREGIRMLTGIVADVRKVCAALRPSVLDYSGLSQALETCAKNFSRHGRMTVQFNQDPALGKLPAGLETVLYRIAQEALTNCAKHAGARKVELKLGVEEGCVTMTVSDDGIGFDPAELASGSASPGLGLLSMRERTELLGGSLMIDTLPGAGTRIRVSLPCIDEQPPGPPVLAE
jgi:PAS domain S-box-containing protein